MHAMILRTLLLILIVPCPFSPVLADDWPQWRGPDRTGVSKETGLLESWPPGGPKLLWTFRDAGLGHSSMAVVGDRLYSMGAKLSKEYVYAVDLNTQKKLWSVEVGPRLIIDVYGDGPRSTPASDGNFVYALGGHGNLVCVETTSGKKVWSQDLKELGEMGETLPTYGYCESPLLDGDRVVVTPGGPKGSIAVFDKKTGKLKWRSTTFTDALACPSSIIVIETGGVRQYVKNFGRVAGVRASDGKLLWKRDKNDGGGGINTPIHQDDCIYTTGSHLIKLIPDGDKFNVRTLYGPVPHCIGSEHSGALLLGKYLYGYSGNTRNLWVCQDFKTGKVIWTKKLEGKTELGSIIAEGNVYLYQSGNVLLIKATPDGYQERGRLSIPEKSKLPRRGGGIWAFPVVASGKLYLRDQDLIFCYDVRKSSYCGAEKGYRNNQGE